MWTIESFLLGHNDPLANFVKIDLGNYFFTELVNTWFFPLIIIAL